MLSSRSGAIALVTGALLLTAFVAVPLADSSSAIYACVNRKSGMVRIVSKAAKCRRGASRLSWNTEGPTGREGPTGKNGLTKQGLRGKEGPAGKEGPTGKEGPAGKNGASGASAGYSVDNDDVEALSDEEVTIAQKALPASSYIVSAKADLSASANMAMRAGAICSLKTSSTQIDKAIWTVELAENSVTTHFEGASTVSLLGPLTITEATTVSLACRSSVEVSGLVTDSSSAVITAVQTSGNS